jgi:hypothetical protein
MVLGAVASLLLLLSSVGHSLMGWPELRIQLEVEGITPDLLRALQVAWQFGGMAMFTFGLILLKVFVDASRGKPFHPDAARVIGSVYLFFGVWAMTFIELHPLYLAAVFPGLMLLVAAWPKK